MTNSAATSRLLNSEEFGQLFKSFEKSAFRLETLPQYLVDAEANDLSAYLDGSPLPTSNRYEGEWYQWIRESTNQGRSWSRVHIIPDQLSPYLRFEIEWGYAHSARAGEDIRLLFPREVPPLPTNLPLEDFWLFDDKKVVKMYYEEDGRYLGAEIAEDEKMLPAYQQVKAFALENSITLKQYLKEIRNSQRKT